MGVKVRVVSGAHISSVNRLIVLNSLEEITVKYSHEYILIRLARRLIIGCTATHTPLRSDSSSETPPNSPTKHFSYSSPLYTRWRMRC